MIEWNQDEIEIIYAKLITELDKITVYLGRHQKERWYTQHISELVNEMFCFLEHEKDDLKDSSTYDNVLQKTRSLLFKLRGFNKIEKALFSDNDKMILNALRELDYLIYYNGPSSYTKEISIVLNRILLEAGSEARIEQCLFYIETWIRRDNLFTDIDSKSILSSILEKYQKKDNYFGYDVPFLFQNLTSIADFLDSNKYNNDAVKYWLEIKRKKIFNNL